MQSWNVLNYLMSYIGDGYIALLFVFSLIYMAIISKNKRKIYVYPTVLLIILVINPIMYKYIWFKIFETTYWRLYWCFPVVIVIGYAFVRIINTIDKFIMKIVSTFLLAGLIIVSGTNVYKSNEYLEKSNWYKLPQEVVDVSEELLSMDDEPRVIMPRSLCVYTRIYSSKIQQLYGRDLFGYICAASYVAKLVDYKIVLDASYDVVITYARQYNYKYLVLEKENNRAVEQGYEFVKEVDGYYIYKVGNM